jgi:hypothetical protein
MSMKTWCTVAFVGLAFGGLLLSLATQEARASDADAEAEAEQEAAEKTARELGKATKARKGKDIDAGLSWRVALLPYLGYENLHRQFHHDEPWNSPHNKNLIDTMPPIYDTAQPLPEGHTTYVALVSPRSAVTRETGGIKMSDIQDGASNTILCVMADADYAVPWSKPEDIRFDPEHPLRGLGERGYFLALFVDGSVHRLPASIDATTMRRLVYRNDGKPVSFQATTGIGAGALPK